MPARAPWRRKYLSPEEFERMRAQQLPGTIERDRQQALIDAAGGAVSYFSGGYRGGHYAHHGHGDESKRGDHDDG